MPDQYIKQKCWSYKAMDDTSDVVLEVSSVSNTSSVDYILKQLLSYPTQSENLKCIGKCEKGDL